jgi:hypothetical protein
MSGFGALARGCRTGGGIHALNAAPMQPISISGLQCVGSRSDCTRKLFIKELYMSNGKRQASCLAQLAMMLMLNAASADLIAATPAGGRLYLSVLSGPLYRLDYRYDGADSLTLSVPQLLATLPRGGGVRMGSDGYVYVVGAGGVHRVDPGNGSFTSVSAMNNANTVSFDPGGALLWAGWKDTAVSSVPIDPLADGTPHAVSGDDSIATAVAFTPDHGVFYTTGGEFESGNFGRIDLATFVTLRLHSDAQATGAIHDTFSGDLIVAGLGQAKQIAPGNPSAIKASRNDSAGGENYLNLQADGRGHLFGTRSGAEARLVMIDYSASGLIDAADTVMLSIPIAGISNLSGEVAVDIHVLFNDGFEGFVP